MNILQVFNSRIQKHGSFEDFMIELVEQAKDKNRIAANDAGGPGRA